MNELPDVGLFRDGARIGVGARFVRFSFRTKEFEACVFWTAAPIRPGELIDLELKRDVLLRVKGNRPTISVLTCRKSATSGGLV